MFVALEALLKSCGNLKLSLQMKGDAIVVAVMPTGTAKDPSLLQPLVLTASAVELDAGFVEVLQSYAGAHVSLAEQVAATTAILGAAEQTQVSKATKAIGKGGRPALPAPGASSETTDDPDTDSGNSDEVESNTSASAKAEAPSSSGTNLASLFE